MGRRLGRALPAPHSRTSPAQNRSHRCRRRKWCFGSEKCGNHDPGCFCRSDRPPGLWPHRQPRSPWWQHHRRSTGGGRGIQRKWVELLKEAVPKVTRTAVLRNPTHPLAEVFQRETQAAGKTLGLQLDFFDARDPNQVASALSNMEKQRAEALIVTPAPLFTSQRKNIVDFVINRHLPSMFFAEDFVDAGGLMSYGPSFPDSYRRAAAYVDKILKGAKPTDLPIEQRTKFEFVINLKTAKQIGLTIPPNVLARADRVIR